MKYPQLVSTRAVNAISDWLVSRLELLGVEAPLIYSRLLLSLLHSSVQINDPIEFNNLETYLAIRKGQKRNYHHPPSDSNTLKKLTAVQCLTEAVSSEQEITNIENLVDELCEKLNDIEKQINSDEETNNYQTIGQILNFITVVGSTSEITTPTTTSSFSSSANATTSSNLVEAGSSGFSSVNTNNNTLVNIGNTIQHRNNNKSKTRIVIDLKDIEDPRKRYYSAFPALSKEMEDSFRISNRNTKALTWPNGKISSLIQQHINHNNINNNNSNNNQNELCIRSNSNNNLTNINTAGVKRKPKRRRNQALSKGRTSNNQRKNSYSGNCSPTWDTDFEGSWEMGRDLIKEFKNHRNRSTSESAAYNVSSTCSNNNNIVDEINHEKRMKQMDSHDEIDFYKLPSNMENQFKFDNSNIFENKEVTTTTLDDITTIGDYSISSDIMQDEISSTTEPTTTTTNNLKITNDQNCNNILLSDEGYSTHENLTSLSELDTNIVGIDINNVGNRIIGNLNSAQRRLYERDASDNLDDSMSLCSNIEQQQYDFAQFKAKFNSSVEALWKNPNDNNNINNENSINCQKLNSLPVTTTTTHQDLDNFWTNYYNHRYDGYRFMNVEKKNDSPPSQTVDGRACNQIKANNLKQNNEYFSMPNQLIKESKLKVPSSFLQDSIWSDSANNYDDDESFYANVMKSSYKNDNKLENNIFDGKDQNFPYNISKWSEGVNAVSPMEQQFIISATSSAAQPSNITEITLNAKDTESRENMLKNSYFYNYKQQKMKQQQEKQIDEQQMQPSSTTLSNLVSAFHNNNNTFSSLPSYLPNNSNITVIDDLPIREPEKITLQNHSKTNSGFIEYSSIKNTIEHDFSYIATSDIFKKSTSSLYSSNSPDEENLLTSDRTHFRPIKQTYADGYVFDISNYLDEITYERSPSGYLCFDGDKYLEYKRSDGVHNNEEDSTTSTNLFGNRIFADTSGSKPSANKKKREEFILKFRVKSRNEKCCQTDPPIPNMTAQQQQQWEQANFYILRAKGRNINNNKRQYQQLYSSSSSSATTNEVISNYFYFEDENQSSTSSEDIDTYENCEFNSSTKDCCSMASATAAAAAILAAVANNNNQFDYTDKLQNWSMIEIGKKCSAAAGNNNNNNSNTNLCVNNTNENVSDNHTLWGLCPACNTNDLESMPANRLLKDELKIEADEIMSDLKYMQDLYIGSDWEEGTCSSNGDITHSESDIADTDFENDNYKDCEYFTTLMVTDDNTSDTPTDKNAIFSNETYNKCDGINEDPNYVTLQDDPQQKDLYYNVTKLIADLLKPENAKSLASALGEAAIHAATHGHVGDDNCRAEKDNNNMLGFCGGLWTSDENYIWKNDELKPIDNYLLRLSNNNNNNFIDTSKKLNWEYSNLADIWNKHSPESAKKNENSKDNKNEHFNMKNFCFEKNNYDHEEKIKQLDFSKHIEGMKENYDPSNSKLDKNDNKHTQNPNKCKTSLNISQKQVENLQKFKENLQGDNNTYSYPHQKLTHKQIEKSKNLSSTSIDINKKINRFDRKRRHSASQMTTNNNNNDTPSLITATTSNAAPINDSSNTNNTNLIANITTHSSGFLTKDSTSRTTINNIIGKKKENIQFQINNNCRNFLKNCNNIIGGGDNNNILNRNNNTNEHVNFYENFIIDGNKIELMTAKDLMMQNINDYNNSVIKPNSTTTAGATIITCKYWTLDTATDMAKDLNSTKTQWKNCNCLDNNIDCIGGGGGAEGFPTINPSSILKHVALVSRPLTR